MRFLLISLSFKNGNWIFQSLNHVDIKSGYYIVPSPSTALAQIKLYSFILLDWATLTLLGSSEGDNSGYGCVLRQNCVLYTVEYTLKSLKDGVVYCAMFCSLNPLFSTMGWWNQRTGPMVVMERCPSPNLTLLPSKVPIL